MFRQEDGGLRAFSNHCLHRQTELLPGGRGRAGAEFACPYHGWRYGRDGILRDAPQAEGLPARPRGALESFALERAGGLVWVSPEPAPPPFDEFVKDIRPLLEDFDARGFAAWRGRDDALAVNWKAVIENLCEAYHIGTVHKDSVGRIDDRARLEVSETPPLCLLTIPLGAGATQRLLDRLCLPSGLSLSARRRERYHKLVVAPNAIVNLTPLFMTVYQAWPTGPGSCLLRYAFLPRRGLNPLARLRVLASYLGSRLILREDLRVLARFQRGQNHRSRPHVLHALERAVGFLARERAKRLDG